MTYTSLNQIFATEEELFCGVPFLQNVRCDHSVMMASAAGGSSLEGSLQLPQAWLSGLSLEGGHHLSCHQWGLVACP